MPDAVFAWSYSGVALALLSRWDDAAAALDRVVALDGGIASIYALRSTVSLVLERHAQAVADAKRAIALEPENPSWQRDLALALTGRADGSQRARHYDDAEHDVRAAVAVCPDEPRFRFKLAEILFDAQADDTGAVCLEEALDVWHSNPGPVPDGLAALCRTLFHRFADDENPALTALEAFARAGALEPLGQGLVASLDSCSMRSQRRSRWSVAGSRSGSTLPVTRHVRSLRSDDDDGCRHRLEARRR